MSWSSALGAFGFALGCAGGLAAQACHGRAPTSGEQSGLSAAAPPAARDARQPSPSTESAESQRCKESIERLNGEPALPGAPVNTGFDRALLLGRARGEPVVFLRAPVFDSAHASKQARALREELARDEHPAFAFERVLAKVSDSPELAREVFLTEGYLYSESAELGALYVNYLALGLLFREPRLRVARGAHVLTLKRRERDYEYEDGPERGSRARILLFDRVFIAGQDPGPALHLDTRPLAGAPFADELRLERMTDSGAVAALRFGGHWLAAALKRNAGSLELDCQRTPTEAGPAVSLAQDWAKRRQAVTEVLASVVKDEVEQALPFDEPKTEDGQQDGQLRPAWRRAYLEGRERYEFNDDTYSVFDSRGRPRVPQVCIDFVTDTFERASGARIGCRGQPRALVRGRLDFDDFGLDNRRSVETFVSFTRAHPEWFEFSETALEARVPFRARAEFFRDIYARRDEYRPFDIVIVFGLRSDAKLHYHSFFVADRDPVTGMPIAVVANAGRPRIRSWESELANAPKRAILAHIRPKLAWLEANVARRREVGASEVCGLPPSPERAADASPL